MRRLIPSFLLVSVAFSSCMVADLVRPKVYETQHNLRGTEASRYAIEGSLAEDSLVLSMIRPYQVELITRMNRVIGQAESEFSNVRPNGSLGDLVADMLRRTASERLGIAVDIGITNWGGLRMPIHKGPIRVGDVYAVMPFENSIVVLTFKGSQIRAIADQLADMGGHPISGLRMRIEDGKAVDVLVGTRAIKDEETYTVATNNFLADGGDRFTSLMNPLKREDLNIMMRDAMIRYINDRYSVTPTFDSRLR